jgi:hypothetical protein
MPNSTISAKYNLTGPVTVSRLDSFIRRMQAQRAVLDHAASMLARRGGATPWPGPDAPVLELGLGNGRTFDHMRNVLPGRRIIAFDRANAANPRSCPEPGDLVLGEIQQTGAAFARQHGALAVLAHADLGIGVAADDAALSAWLAPLMHALVRPAGLVLSSTELHHPGLLPQDLPPEVPHGRYFIYARA